MKKAIQNQIIIYNTADGETKIEVRMKDETVWLSQKQMAELFDCSVDNISLHLKNIFKEAELGESSVTEEYSTTASDGKNYLVKNYNLDVIISVGYRVKSSRGTQFRIWATQKLREYIVKGFVIDDERLKGTGGGDYWKELLDRIRDIRSSEKALYRQVLDLYATSIDYDPHGSESIAFFKVVQNKLHYATNQYTAAETIAERADAKKDFMGLTTFAGVLPILSEVTVAKNYLTEDELFRLNRMVSAFFDLAEIKAREKQKMRMVDWVAELDKFVKNYGKGVLQNAGKVSNEQATEKAIKEYRKFQAKTLSPVEKAYLENIKLLDKKVKKKIKNL
ncbi:MAG: virulence RhuM family protein [Parcubacteria group bacterium]|jgi:hypothetical protein